MDQKTEQLIKDIKEYYNVFDLSGLNDKQWIEVSGEVRIMDKQYDNLYDSEPSEWSGRLTPEFIEKYADRLEWTTLVEYNSIPEYLLDRHFNKIWYPDMLPMQQTLSEDFLEKYIDYFSFEDILAYQELSKEFIERHIDKVNFKTLFIYQKNLSVEFFDKYRNKMESTILDLWGFLSSTAALNIPIFEKYEHMIDWNGVSGRVDLDFNFLKRFKDRLNWNILSRKHAFTPEELLYFSDKIDLNAYFEENFHSSDAVQKVLTKFLEFDLKETEKYFTFLTKTFDIISNITRFTLFFDEYTEILKQVTDRLNKELSDERKLREFGKFLKEKYPEKIAKVKILNMLEFIKKVNNEYERYFPSNEKKVPFISVKGN